MSDSQIILNDSRVGLNISMKKITLVDCKKKNKFQYCGDDEMKQRLLTKKKL